MFTRFFAPSLWMQLHSVLYPKDASMAVSPQWLLRGSSSLDRGFVQRAKVTTEPAGDLTKVMVNGISYLWPSQAEVHALLTILSELTNPLHPHHYLAEQTKITPGDVVLDIGACEGSFTARAAELGADVIAVEPSKMMTQIIYALFELRGLPRPTVVNTLLGAKPEELHFIDNIHNPGASRIVPQPEMGSYSVPVTTLDSMVESLQLENLSYIKCDAEGADVDILKSGRKTLERFHPKIAITTYHNSTDYREMFRYLKEIGYNLKGKGLLYSNGEFRVIMLHAW